MTLRSTRMTTKLCINGAGKGKEHGRFRTEAGGRSPRRVYSKETRRPVLAKYSRQSVSSALRGYERALGMICSRSRWLGACKLEESGEGLQT